MANGLPTEILQGALDDAYDAAVTADITLRAQLRLYETAKWTVNASGQLIANTSRNSGAGGQSVSFFAPGVASGFTPVDAQISYRKLINLYDRVAAQLELDDNTTNRAAIKAEMMAQLVPCVEAYQEFSYLRTGLPAAE